MRSTARLATLALALLSASILTGCDEPASKAPDALTTKEAPDTLRKSFGSASGDAKATADQVAASIASANYNEAFLKLNNLSASGSLTPEQRAVIARSQMTVMEQMQKAAAAGDQQAQQLLEFHRASK